MANTTITLDREEGMIVPSSDAVPVVQGDTIDFVGTNDGPAILSFSPDAISVLSPRPTSPLQLAASERRSFTFTSSDLGAYSIRFSSESDSLPQIPTTTSANLFLQVGGMLPPPPPAMTVAGGRTRDGQG